MWDLIVSVPDHCLSFYFTLMFETYTNACQSTNHKILPTRMTCNRTVELAVVWN